MCKGYCYHCYFKAHVNQIFGMRDFGVLSPGLELGIENNAHGIQKQEETYHCLLGTEWPYWEKLRYIIRNKSEGKLSRIIKCYYVVVNICNVRPARRTWKLVTIVSDWWHTSSRPGTLSTLNGEWNLDKLKRARITSNVRKIPYVTAGRQEWAWWWEVRPPGWLWQAHAG